ncbi:CD276 antigen isoform X1 [Alligator mississippiensis]|uniref:CD276 antigen isoform X1 n=2 Tax=Alligator mississippiensis TaxID=8496 RepID=UPI0028774850|nr:CD276 antigen isoform X1 [Alligator mississippiensis]
MDLWAHRMWQFRAAAVRGEIPFPRGPRLPSLMIFAEAMMKCLWLIPGLLVFSLAGAIEIQVPDDPVVALFGRDATLCCSFSPDANFSLDKLSLIWQLTDTKRLVHSFSGGQDQLADQGGGYVNRTALFYDQLPQGNVSLLLRRVQISDEGSFTCFVRVQDYSSAAVMLQVAASYSKPNLNLEPNKNLKPGDLVTVTCLTFRGYPEAIVLWQDGQGNNFTENVTTSQVANEEGLFDVQSVLRVVLEPTSTYSCLVRNPVLQEETQASVTITGQHLTFPAVALWVTIALAICLLGLLGALAYVCRKKIRQSCKEEEENAGMEDQDEDGEEPKTALQPLKSAENKEDNEQEIA